MPRFQLYHGMGMMLGGGSRAGDGNLVDGSPSVDLFPMDGTCYHRGEIEHRLKDRLGRLKGIDKTEG